MRNVVVKRLLDILGAGSGLLILLPVILILAWMIRRRLGRFVADGQTLPGLRVPAVSTPSIMRPISATSF